MDPLTIALIGGGVQLATGIAQSITGATQRRRARRELSRLQDPQMEVPSSVTEMVNLARIRAGQDMPGLDTMRGELGAITQRGIQRTSLAARTPGELASATKDLFAEEMRGIRDLEIASAQYKSQREGELSTALGTQGAYEQEAFNVNVMMPYQRKLQQYMGDADTGGRNVAAGIGTMATAPISALEKYMQMQMLQNWTNQ